MGVESARWGPLIKISDQSLLPYFINSSSFPLYIYIYRYPPGFPLLPLYCTVHALRRVENLQDFLPSHVGGSRVYLSGVSTWTRSEKKKMHPGIISTSTSFLIRTNHRKLCYSDRLSGAYDLLGWAYRPVGPVFLVSPLASRVGVRGARV